MSHNRRFAVTKLDTDLCHWLPSSDLFISQTLRWGQCLASDWLRVITWARDHVCDDPRPSVEFCPEPCPVYSDEALTGLGRRQVRRSEGYPSHIRGTIKSSWHDQEYLCNPSLILTIHYRCVNEWLNFKRNKKSHFLCGFLCRKLHVVRFNMTTCNQVWMNT